MVLGTSAAAEGFDKQNVETAISIELGTTNSCVAVRSDSCVSLSPSGLGIETEGGVMADVIPRGSLVPKKKSQIFTTYCDHQTTMSIKATVIIIFSGNERLTKYCRKLGMLQFSGIPPAPRGVAKN
ncbi:unnamed protein product [Coffea canephora]|uniref:Uncharacterized protein n=1 Tax=Coffea canephora TaxID=49390 RepID=A0A068V4J0_COFCA|nr:unnamed protein product [Coffea canephora]